MSTYGAIETNPITEEHKRIRDAASTTVALSDPRLVRITRLRLVTDRDFPLWDLSYCYGRLADGTDVRVQLPEWQWPKSDLMGSLIEMFKREKRYAKGMGLFEPDTISKLYG